MALHNKLSSPPLDSNEFVTLAPLIFRTCGTSGSMQLRHAYDRVQSFFGEKPDHLIFQAMDTTHQQHSDDVEMLPHEMFRNLVAQPQVIDKLRRAHEHPHVRKYMHQLVTRLPAGNGIGGFEQGTRFLYEQAAPELAEWIGDSVEPFAPANRGKLAEASALNSVLRAWNATVSQTEPVRVVYLVNTPGGSAGALMHDVFFLNSILQSKKIEATFTLFLTPAAYAPGCDVEAIRKGRKLYARLQEIVDLLHGKEQTWEFDGWSIHMAGCPFESIFVLPEPAPGALAAHHRMVGELLLQLTTPLGQTLWSKAVDQTSLFHETGPRGQKKFLSRINIATAHATACEDVVGYAVAVLGAEIGKGADVNVECFAADIARSAGMTPELVESPALHCDRPEIPQQMRDPGPFLKHSERTAQADLAQQQVEQLAVVDQVVSHLLAATETKSNELLQTAGPNAAAQLLTAVGERVAQLEERAVCRHGKLARRSVEQSRGSFNEQIEVVCKRQLVLAHTSYLAEVVKAFRASSERLQHRRKKMLEACSVLRNLQTTSDDVRLEFEAARLRSHAVLDLPRLAEIFQREAGQVVSQVRAAVLEDDGNHFDSVSFANKVKQLVRAAAEPFAHFRDFNKALSVAGERGMLVLRTTVQSATPIPSALDSNWDPARHSAQFMLTSVPERHPMVATARETCPNVVGTATWSMPGAVTCLGVQFGIEPGALQATSRAVESYLSSKSDVAPFPDQHYEPLADVLTPPESEWFAWLAIPLHLLLRTGVIRWEDGKGWLYDGTLIGANRRTCSQALLSRHGRPANVPSLDELCAQTERLLQNVGDINRAIETLSIIEQRLTLEAKKSDPATRLIVTLERAATRSLLSRYREQSTYGAAHRKVWANVVCDPNSEVQRLTRPWSNRFNPTSHENGNGKHEDRPE